MAKKRITLPKDFKEILERNDVDELKAVFDGCDINAYERDSYKTPALCMYGISEEFIEWLVQHGADIEAANSYGRTALHIHAGVNQMVQGEVIRICGKVSREILDNGAVNWSREYKKLPQALPGYFAMGNPISNQASGSSLIHRVFKKNDKDEEKEMVALARSIGADSDEETLDRLCELAVKWVLANPQPIKLEKVNYTR